MPVFFFLGCSHSTGAPVCRHVYDDGPMEKMATTETLKFTTDGSIGVVRNVASVCAKEAVSSLAVELDSSLGVLLSSTYEYPGRYTRWDIGFKDPCLVFTGRQRAFTIDALNGRGEILLPRILRGIEAGAEFIQSVARIGSNRIEGKVKEVQGKFAEEDRSKQPSLFSVVRCIVGMFRSSEDGHLGLYGSVAL